MTRRTSVDLPLVAAAVVLAISGLIFLYSTSSWISQQQLDSSHRLVLRQAIKAVVGFALLAAFCTFDHRRFGGYVAWIAWGVLGTLLAVLAWPDAGGNGLPDRWLRLGPAVIQPAEFARVGVILLLAWLLSEMDEAEWRKPRASALWCPALCVLLPVGLVLAQPNFGTAVAICASALAVAVLAGIPWRWLAGSAAVAAGIAAIVTTFYSYPLERIQVWMAGLGDWSALPFQIRQGMIALGSGGPFGVGIGQSIQKRQFVPDAHTDLISTIIGEEVGFVGLLFVIVLFAVVMWRGFAIARRSRDRFGYLLAAGLTIQIGLYAVINLGVVTGLVPVTGLPLPFVSYGGSALIANMVAVGLIASVSRQEPAPARRGPRRVMALGL